MAVAIPLDWVVFYGENWMRIFPSNVAGMLSRATPPSPAEERMGD